MYEYKVDSVTKVIDGDTVRCRVDLGCDVRLDMTIRLAGINAPEISTDAGKSAREYLASLLDVRSVTVMTIKDRKEKYGRYLGVFMQGDVNLNQKMIECGHAVAYDGGKRTTVTNG